MSEHSTGAAVRTSIEKDTDPTTAVVEAVAAVTDTPPADLPPLHAAVHTDALNTVFAADRTGDLTFAYAGCDVTVHDGTAVTVSPTTE